MKHLTGLILAGFLLLCFSCGNNSNQPDMDDAKEDVGEMLDETNNAVRAQWAEFRDELKDTKQKIDDEIQEIDEELASAGADARKDLNERKAKLQAWSNEIGLHMQELGNDITDGWQKVKNETNDLLEDVESYFDDHG